MSKLNEAILQKNANQKNVSSSIYNFSINTNVCKMITVDSLTTYTFEVTREQDNGFFENLVVQELTDGTFKTKLFRYNVTAQEKENILKGIDVDMTNKISTILIDDPSFVTDIFSKIYFSTFCYESSTVYVQGTPCGGIQAHNWNEACPHAGTALAAQPPSLQTVYTMVPCPIDETGGGSEPTGPTDTGEIGGGGTSPTGGGGLGEIEEEETPCSRMKKNSNKTSFKQRFKELNTSTNYNKEFETGYYEKADGSLNFMTGTKAKRTLTFLPTMISFMHTHMNDFYEKDSEGNYHLVKPVKMLSPGDINSLISCGGNAIQNNLSPLDSYALMLSNEGLFSASLLETSFPFYPETMVAMQFEYRNLTEKILQNISGNSDSQKAERKKQLQIVLLKLLKEKGLENKIAIFEATDSTPSALPTINWTRKTLDSNNMLIETPCIQ